MTDGVAPSIIGQGVYPIARAATLIGTSQAKLRRWTRGTRKVEPLFGARYRVYDTSELSFADLVEARVVNALRKAGIPLQAIRHAMGLARDRFGQERPFASSRFKTDGRDIFILVGEKAIYSLSHKNPAQRVFAEIVAPTLVDLEYEEGRARRWRPEHHERVVLDPNRAFGRSVIDATGVPTETLVRAVDLHGVERTARYYEVPVADVRAAIAYEEALAA
ncbi:MerR family transcriptional regulator [Jannaschia sp. LMIT008]|uniref:MerR family transcriptional regulator n=1 Tax=Jannaschia maritima TaxID=3032585 RepID=UPI002810C5B6|nr:MerR family transcriptional regulator [Jannaschia sp. LMIT008]